MNKVDTTGKYLPFQGISFVCMLDDTELSRWGKLYDFLLSLDKLTKYYSPLPVSSYHFTVKNHKVAVDLSEFIEYNLLNVKEISRMNQVCRSYNYHGDATLVDTYIRGTIGIYVKPPNVDKLESLRSEITSIGSFPEDGFVYHVTLGYRYREVPKSERDAVRKQFQMLHDYIDSLFRFSNYNFKVKPCKMVYFPDMTTFIPLNHYSSPNLRCIRYSQKDKIYTLAIFNSDCKPGFLKIENIDIPYDYVKNNIENPRDIVIVLREDVVIQPTSIWIDEY